MPPKMKRTTSVAQTASAATFMGRRDTVERKQDSVSKDEEVTKTRSQALVKPADQEDLTDAELKEEITNILTGVNPQVPKSLVQFSFREQGYRMVPHPGHMIWLFTLEGHTLHKDSEEAKHQMARLGLEGRVSGAEYGEELLGVVESVEATEESDKPEEEGEKKEEEGEGEKKEEGEPDADAEQEQEHESDSKKGTPEDSGHLPGKKLTNQFNYCDRASQTFSYALRVQNTQTVPPPRSRYGSQANQWIIHDAYVQDFERQQREKEKAAAKPGQIVAKREDTAVKRRLLDVHGASTDLSKIANAAQIIERMVNQNIYDEISHDFKFYEDPSDEFRDNEGTLLPLWKFAYERTKRHTVTAICWNRSFNDLFAVGFGSYDFNLPTTNGTVCLFSLKNPSYPEFTCTLPSGVMSLDLHSTQGHLMVAGLYDGNVAVINTQLPPDRKQPQLASSALTGKHVGPVWKVQWCLLPQDGDQCFYSVATDGHVYCWLLLKTELSRMPVITLSLPADGLARPDGTISVLKASGTALAFHPKEPNIFLVGTEDGIIHKCSTAYTSLYLMTYQAHKMPVCQIQWNNYYPSIFISCSADWKVKIWEQDSSTPLFVFDLGSAVGNVEWAPYSSTVFGAVTGDGKVHVIDLAIKKYHPICSQSVVPRKKTRLTHISFNPNHPVIVVGDDRGQVTCLKLSPNLRKKPKEPKKGEKTPGVDLELVKIERLLTLVREPKSLAPTTEEA